MQKINRANMNFDYDPLYESVIETVTGEVVYRESGIGEVDLRDVMRGEVHWLGPGNVEDPTQPLFTFDDFVSEILIPDLEKQNVFVAQSGEMWKARTETSPTMQEIRTLDMDEVVDFILQANDIGIDDDDYIFDDEGGYFQNVDAVIEELSYRRGYEESQL